MENVHNNFVFHATKAEQAAECLDSHLERGLTINQVKERIEEFGRNTIRAEETITPFQILVNQFKNPIVFLLLFAAGMSFWFNEWLDGIAILCVIFINAAIGFYMEFKAQVSMQALKKMSSVPAKVWREGKLSEINSEEIVIGDIVFVDAGDMIPIDGLIYRSTQLLIDESALTGESLPIEKRTGVMPQETILADRTNMVFKGTYVFKGNAFVLVCATGMETELGKIARLVHTSDQAATPLEKKLADFSEKLIKITVVLVVVIFITGLLNGQHILEMLETSIALAVAAIPEGLPIVATLSLAQGMLKLARHNVIVKKLSAVETLGCTNVICTDKTGTLTQNKMEVVQIITPSVFWQKNSDFTGNNAHLQLITDNFILCNTAELEVGENDVKEIGDPLEIALLKFARLQGENIDTVRHQFSKKGEMAFTSETKMMATLHEKEGKQIAFAKGAVEELIAQCTHILENDIVPIDATKYQYWTKEAEKLSALGHRVIALAYRGDITDDHSFMKNLVFIGLVGMIDPPREEVVAAIQECKTAGIKVVMITGDHPATAQYIAAQLGIIKPKQTVMLGKDMKDYEDLNEEDKKKWLNTPVFARVNPKHKLDLVKVFQEKSYIVGMTGDGVNDAPAIKKADIGIAMGQRGTQVAQEVSDMVLKNDSFTSIALAIRQGRIIFENIRKFVTFLLSCNLSEILVIATASIMNLHFQLLPLQILFINLITDVLPALALGVTRGSDTVMKAHPRQSSVPIIDKDRWKLIFFYAIAIAFVCPAGVLLNHYVYHKNEVWDTIMCNNILFFSLILCQLLHVFNMGTGAFFRSEVMRNKFVWYSMGINCLILFGVIQIPFVQKALNIVPMTVNEWVVILLSGLAFMIIVQVGKRFSFFQNIKNSHDEISS